MKKIICAFVALGGLLIFSSCDEQNKVNKMDRKLDLSGPHDSLSYSLGINVGHNLQTQGLDSVDLDIFLQGIADYNNQKGKLDPQEASIYVTGYMDNKVAATHQVSIDENEKWLAANTEGYTKSESGLYYRIVEPGSDVKPTMNDVVVVDYNGYLTNGTKFDSSIDRGMPLNYPMKQFVKGWQEGLQYIGEGGKIDLIVPHNLGYGPRPGPGGLIPAFSVLVFDIQLIEVES